MEVILREDVENLGFKNELIKVKPGFGRNYLIPKGLAMVANATNKKVLTETLKQQSKKEETIKAAAKELATKLSNTEVVVKVKAGDKGKLFGSVSNIQLAEAIKKEGLDVDKKFIRISGGTVKEVGTYEARIRLHRDVEAIAKFKVEADKK